MNLHKATTHIPPISHSWIKQNPTFFGKVTGSYRHKVYSRQ